MPSHHFNELLAEYYALQTRISRLRIALVDGRLDISDEALELLESQKQAMITYAKCIETRIAYATQRKDKDNG